MEGLYDVERVVGEEGGMSSSIMIPSPCYGIMKNSERARGATSTVYGTAGQVQSSRKMKMTMKMKMKIGNGNGNGNGKVGMMCK